MTASGAYRTGDWQRSNHWQSIVQITRGDEVLVFDPPDIVFINGGERVRVVDYDGPSPVLEVDRISGEVTRYPMRPTATGDPEAQP